MDALGFLEISPVHPKLASFFFKGGRKSTFSAKQANLSTFVDYSLNGFISWSKMAE